MGYKVKRIMVGDKQVRPYRTFTIQRTEKSDMSSGWTYSDDATGLTAGSTAFDDFFGYSAVLLNTSGTETAEIKQSGGVFSSAITNLGNITSGDNVMIKFPKRGIKISKSGSVVTLSITNNPNASGFQYYAFQTGQTNNITDTKDRFYLGAYLAYNNSNVLKSWSGKSPTDSVTQVNFCSYAKANNSNLLWNIEGFYQRMYIYALYMMKYGNPASQSVVGLGYTGGSSKTNTGGTNSQTNATYGTSSGTTQCRLFGLEDWWGNIREFIGGHYTDSSKVLYTQLSGYDGSLSGGVSTGTTITRTTGYRLASIAGNNEAMFMPLGTANSGYYMGANDINPSRSGVSGSYWGEGNPGAGLFFFGMYNTGSSYSGNRIGTRLMYL